MSVAGSLVLAVGHGWTSCSGGTTEGQPGLWMSVVLDCQGDFTCVFWRGLFMDPCARFTSLSQKGPRPRFLVVFCKMYSSSKEC